MLPIRIINRNFDLIDEIDRYESFMITRSWHGIGDFELRINRYMQGADELLKGRIIIPYNQLDKVYIIRHREIELDENGKASENWIIKGYQLKSIANQRVTVPPAATAYDNKKADAETVMKHYVDRNFVNPVDPKRKIPSLTIAPNFQRGKTISWQSRYKDVGEELEEISQATGIGWNIYLDYENKKFVFDVYEGRDVTAGQTVNPPVIFSPEFESIKSQGFVDSDMEMKNVGYIGGQGEGKDREIILIGDAEGLDRLESFVDARDVDEEEGGANGESLEERGQRKMDELKTEQYFEAQILSPVTRTITSYQHDTFVNPYQSIGKATRRQELYSTFHYGVDYDLGDIPTIQNKSWGVTMDARITVLKEIYETGGFKLEAVFGQDRPTLISKIKDKFNQIDNELTR